jgi:ribonuclease J
MTLGPFKVEFIKVAHSIPESCGLAIRTPAGLVVHTGDWKIDDTPMSAGRQMQRAPQAAGRRGRSGDDLRLDQCHARWHQPGEADVAKTLDELIRSSAGPRGCDHLRLERGTHPRAVADRRDRLRPRSRGRRPRAMERVIDVARDCGMLDDACPTSAPPRPSATCRARRWSACSPAARASRALRCHASPMDQHPRGRAVARRPRHLLVPHDSRATRRPSAASMNALADQEHRDRHRPAEHLVHVSGHPAPRRAQADVWLGAPQSGHSRPWRAAAPERARQALLDRARSVAHVLVVGL